MLEHIFYYNHMILSYSNIMPTLNIWVNGKVSCRQWRNKKQQGSNAAREMGP